MENQWKKIVAGGVIISREVQEITYCKYMCLTILSLQFGTLKKWCAIKCFSVLSIISIRIYKCVCVRTNLQFKYIQKSPIKDTPTKGQCIDNLS